MSNKTIHTYIAPGKIYSAPIAYMLSVLGKNKQIAFQPVDDASAAEIVFDETNTASLPVAKEFYNSLLAEKKFSFRDYFHSEPLIRDINGNADLLATAFYLLNAFQEYGQDPQSADAYGRFRYEASLQYHFGTIGKNEVQALFDLFCRETPALKGLEQKHQPTRFFLSHDIDSIHGALLEDGFWALKRGRLGFLFRLMMNAVLLRPDWKNMDLINRIHDEYSFTHAYFWIVNKATGEQGIKNADYTVRQVKKEIMSPGFHGLHKSSCAESVASELQKMPVPVRYNRYHFLKYTLPSGWENLEETGIRLDASLGFAEHFGFRNSYGLPFRPFNIKKMEPFSFVEVPLHLMDRTFQQYMKVPVQQTAGHIIDFIGQHPSDCILSLLWHNNFFAPGKYGGYFEEYKKVLLYLAETKSAVVSPEDIIQQYL